MSFDLDTLFQTWLDWLGSDKDTVPCQTKRDMYLFIKDWESNLDYNPEPYDYVNGTGLTIEQCACVFDMLEPV